MLRRDRGTTTGGTWRTPDHWLPAAWIWACLGGALALALAAPSPVTAGDDKALRPFSAQELRRIRHVQPAVRSASKRHDVSVALINGVIWVESKFKPRARGRRGPRGLMQLMPRTGRSIARKLGRRYRPHDVEFNVEAGTYYLSRMLSRFPRGPAWGLAAYNYGPGKVLGWQRSGDALPQSSLRYAARVHRAGRTIDKRLKR